MITETVIRDRETFTDATDATDGEDVRSGHESRNSGSLEKM